MIRVGARVRAFKPGDEVYARPDKDRIGTFAEFISVHEDDLAPKPERLTMEEAASVPLVGLTAWQALIELAHRRSPRPRARRTPPWSSASARTS
ncbi:hypothetical protein [Amycolatopsis sp. NPDC051128]|uniref:hypothetical protein n=1 Tax=Amycolatopsis sp. NPDC051128 TaxID=3155412 RepID=UPI0034136E7C